MNNPVKFELVHSQESVIVREASGRHVAEYSKGQAATAKGYRDFLNNEHRNGRVAQGQCDKGHACDRLRIFIPERISSFDSLILCPDHEAEIIAAKARAS